VLRYLFEESKIHAQEVADLVTEIFRYERATADTSIENSNAMRLQFLDDLAQAESSKVLEVLNSLFNSSEMTAPGTGSFDGALALVEASHLTGVVDPFPLVKAYVAAMARDEYNLSVHQITAVQARTLYELALRTGTDGERFFFDPLKVAERLNERSKADANPYTIADAVSRTIRVHTRVLARAIVAQPEAVPENLVDAVIKTVEMGALNRAERNQVDAFAANYESDFPAKAKDRSISADLGEALSKLVGSQRERLLQAVLKIEEPLALVRLLFFTPAELKSRIERRVRELTPEKATELYMYKAAQMRIDQLLDADFPDVAEAFLYSEFKATTSWSVPGRAVHRLRQQLRLHFLRKEWEEIQRYEIPDGVPEQEHAAAKDAIEFFRGLAFLKMEKGSAKDAETRFEKLQRAQPNVAAYAVNLHAARVALILGQNSFGYLDAEKQAGAFRVISEGQEACSSLRDLSADDEAILRLNNAVLFLAVRQPAQAIDSLDRIPVTAKAQETAFAYRAIALARGGEPWLARGVLEAGVSLFGNLDTLEAARQNIQSETPYAGRVNIVSDPDVVSTIKQALHNLMVLDPGEQARVLTAGNGNVGDFLLTQFREAAAATVDLAPMMRALNADSIEDDISAVFKEILHARLGHIHWSVADQGRGGFTPKEGPGERDFTIKKDAAILSVGEAVMTRHKTTQKFTRGELKSHLEKLFAYATCPAYFHVTYEMSGDEAGVIEHLRKLSSELLIEGIEFIRHEEIPFVDSAPRFFTALYRSAAGTQTVHFLVLDFHQGRQKAAAKASDASNPRK
jgi:tetratricopeptide (TPR) repeat protein